MLGKERLYVLLNHIVEELLQHDPSWKITTNFFIPFQNNHLANLILQTIYKFVPEIIVAFIFRPYSLIIRQ